MSTVAPDAPVSFHDRPGLRLRIRLRQALDAAILAAAWGGAITIILLLALLLAVVLYGAWPAIKASGFAFFVDWRWNPVKESYGAWAAIYGTLVSSVLALLFAVPVSVGSAIFLVRIAPQARGLLRWATVAIFALLAAVIGFLLGTQGLLRFVPSLGTSAGGSLFVLCVGVTACLAAGIGSAILLRHNTIIVAVISFLIELLAAIPSIAYGFWGAAILAPFMGRIQPFLADTAPLSSFPGIGPWLPNTNVGLYLSHIPVVGSIFEDSGTGTNLLSAGIILAIMVVPIITAISRDVLRTVPPELEQGAYGLGATWWQATKVVLSYAKMGIFGAVILGFARAIGETMAVTMVIGNATSRDRSLLAPGQTIASLLANQFAEADKPSYTAALIYAALLLLLITTIINGFARIMIVRVARRAASR